MCDVTSFHVVDGEPAYCLGVTFVLVDGGGKDGTGWRCYDHDVIYGDSPLLDRNLLDTKIEDLLMHWNENDTISISNESLGDIVTQRVGSRCILDNDYSVDNIKKHAIEVLKAFLK